MSWLNRNWRMITAYTVLGVAIVASQGWRRQAEPVLWTGTFHFHAGDQDQIDRVERELGGAVQRVANRCHRPGDHLELVSELRLADQSNQER